MIPWVEILSFLCCTDLQYLVPSPSLTLSPHSASLCLCLSVFLSLCLDPWAPLGFWTSLWEAFLSLYWLLLGINSMPLDMHLICGLELSAVCIEIVSGYVLPSACCKPFTAPAGVRVLKQYSSGD